LIQLYLLENDHPLKSGKVITVFWASTP